MKAIGGISALLGAAALAGTAAAAGPVPVPPLPTPTVTVPPVPAVPVPPLPPAPSTQSPPATPLPALPNLPKPVATAPSAGSAGSVTTTAVQRAVGGSAPTGTAAQTSSSGASGAGSSSASGSGSGSASSSSSGASSRSRVEHFNSSRPWIGTRGPKRRRTTTLVFVLPKATRVTLTVNEVSPACVGIGRFSVRGHAGLNRVRFAGRVHGLPLAPGTYRISARTADGRIVRRVTLVVIDGAAPSRGELRALRAANVCDDDGSSGDGTASFATASASSGSGGGGGATAQALPSAGAPDLTPSISAPEAPDITGGVLASSVQTTARAVRPILVALLLIAIVLLALASVPRVAVAGARTNDLLVRHRTEIAGLGAVALVATAVAFLLS